MFNSNSNGIIAFYEKFFYSLEFSGEKERTQEFISKAIILGIDAFDKKIVDKYYTSPFFIEHRILQYILSQQKLTIGIQYGSIYSRQMNATSGNKDGNTCILVDELLQFTLLSFLYTVFSLINEMSVENCTRCIKNCFVFLDLQGQQKTIGFHNYDELKDMLMLPTNLMHMASDAYWMVWTFIVGHELYHLQSDQMLYSYHEEIAADTYAYKLLLEMIKEQKEGSIPDELHVFSEHLYLAPIMFFEYFRFLDFYKELCGQDVFHACHPSPSDRINNIFSLHDYVPENIDTETGNSILNSFLDAIDYLREQIKIKKLKGKLEIGQF